MTKKKIEVFLPEEMKNKIKKESKLKGITMSELVKRIFEEYLK